MTGVSLYVSMFNIYIYGHLEYFKKESKQMSEVFWVKLERELVFQRIPFIHLTSIIKIITKVSKKEGFMSLARSCS